MSTNLFGSYGCGGASRRDAGDGSGRDGTVEEILAGLGLNPYEILVTCGDELLLADDVVSGEQVLVTTSIVHGG